MSKFEFDKVIEQLNWCHEVCRDCTFEGSMCVGCDIYYDRQKFVHRLHIIANKELGEQSHERK